MCIRVTFSLAPLIAHIVLRLLVSARIHQDLHSCGVLIFRGLHERCAAKLYTNREKEAPCKKNEEPR